jgi:glucokinase
MKAFGTPAGEKLCGASKGNQESITAEMVYRLAESGDPASLSIYQAMGRYLGIGIASLINIFNPEMVVIGGGVSQAWNLFITAAEEEVYKRAFKIPAQRAKLVPAGCGDDAALLGAAYLVLSRDS